MPQALTDKQRKLADAYVINGHNGVEAARSAGYQGTNKALGVTASRTLALPHVVEYLSTLQREAEEHAKKKRRTTVATLSEALATATRIMRKSKTGDFITPEGEIDVRAIKAAPPGVVTGFERKVTTTEEGQVFETVKFKVEPALNAAKTIIAHYDGLDKPPGGGQTNVLVQLVTQGDPKVLPVMRALLSAGAIDVEAREVE